MTKNSTKSDSKNSVWLSFISISCGTNVWIKINFYFVSLKEFVPQKEQETYIIFKYFSYKQERKLFETVWIGFVVLHLEASQPSIWPTPKDLFTFPSLTAVKSCNLHDSYALQNEKQVFDHLGSSLTYYLIARRVTSISTWPQQSPNWR